MDNLCQRVSVTVDNVHLTAKIMLGWLDAIYLCVWCKSAL